MKNGLTQRPFASVAALKMKMKPGPAAAKPKMKPKKKPRQTDEPRAPPIQIAPAVTTHQPSVIVFDRPAPPLMLPPVIDFFACPRRKTATSCVTASCGNNATTSCTFELSGKRAGQRCHRQICSSCATANLCPAHRRLTSQRLERDTRK